MVLNTKKLTNTAEIHVLTSLTVIIGRNLQISVGIRVQDPEPVLQSRGQTLQISVTTSWMDTHTHMHLVKPGNLITLLSVTEAQDKLVLRLKLVRCQSNEARQES